MGGLRVAAVQATPVFLDREATVEVAVARHRGGGVGTGPQLVVFGEAFVPAYPDWVWRSRPWRDGDWYAALGRAGRRRAQRPATTRLGEAARTSGTFVAIGSTSATRGRRSTTRCSTSAPTARSLGVHRKLMPTGGERLVWGLGDGSTSSRYRHAVGRTRRVDLLGELHAARPGRDVRAGHRRCTSRRRGTTPTSGYRRCDTSPRKVGVYVVGVTPFLRSADVRSAAPGLDELYGGDDEWMSRGNTTIVAPGGDVLAGPLVGEAGHRLRRHRPGRPAAAHAASSTSSATTAEATSSSCASTPASSARCGSEPARPMSWLRRDRRQQRTTRSAGTAVAAVCRQVRNSVPTGLRATSVSSSDCFVSSPSKTRRPLTGDRRRDRQLEHIDEPGAQQRGSPGRCCRGSRCRRRAGASARRRTRPATCSPQSRSAHDRPARST